MLWFFCIQIILLSILNAQQLTNLPVTYYVLGQLVAKSTPGDAGWVQLIQCAQGTANNANLQITMIQPNNPGFNPNLPFAVMEVSSCQNSFQQSCIIGTNYVKTGTSHFSPLSNNVTIPFNSSVSYLSIRYQSYIGDAPITFHVTYVDDTAILFKGIFDYSTFSSPNVPTTPASNVGQYVQNTRIDTVMNNYFNYYYFSFCEANIRGHYTVNILVASDPNTPVAAFDLIGCSAYYINSTDDCTFVGANGQGVRTDQYDASITQIAMDSTDFTLSEGIFVGVFGVGGEPDGTNQYSLSIVTVSD